MIIQIILSLVLLYVGFNVLYLLVFSIAGLFRKQRSYSPINPKKRFVILIPAYKEDSVILNTVRCVLEQDYPKDCFDVVVIADQLKKETLDQLASFPIKVVEVFFKNSTKAKALKAAIKDLSEKQYDLAMILDADNLLGKGCLEKVNSASHSGFKMIQLHRTAKNKNTPTAILDAASEEINNHIFRKGHRALGLSSALIGSGMAFDYTDFRTLVMETNMEDNPGEDREIYLELLRKGLVSEYIEDGFVYDEKVQSNQVLEKQRTRWISAQLQYAKRFWGKEFFRTFSYNIHYFDYALQTLLLPRVLLLIVSFFFFLGSLVIHWFTGSSLFPENGIWQILFWLYVGSLCMSVLPYLSFRELAKAMKRLPAVFYHFLKALVKSRANQKVFIHTPKEYN